MTQKVQCPNSGKCGRQHHFMSSDEYAKCLRALSSGQGAISGSLVDMGVVFPPERDIAQYDDFALSNMRFNNDSYHYSTTQTLSDEQVDLLLSGSWSMDEIVADFLDSKDEQDEGFCAELWESIRHVDDLREYIDIKDTDLGQQIAEHVKDHTVAESLIKDLAANTSGSISEPYVFNIGGNPQIDDQLEDICQRIYEMGDDFRDEDVKELTNLILDNFFVYCKGELGDENESRQKVYEDIKDMISDRVGYRLTGEEVNIAWNTQDLFEMIPFSAPTTILVDNPTLNFNIFSGDGGVGSHIILGDYYARFNIGARGLQLNDQDHIHRASHWSDEPRMATCHTGFSTVVSTLSED